MDPFDDIQVEELENYDFSYDDLFEEKKDNKKSFDDYLNSNTDY